jgi:hypothetical protein
MKTFKLIIVITISILLFASCAAPSANVVQSNLPSETATISATESPSESIESDPSEESSAAADISEKTKAVYGDIDNPAPLGEAIKDSISSKGAPLCEFEIKVIDVIRGDDAMKKVLEMNKDNETFAKLMGEDSEYLLVNVSAKNTKDLSGNGKALPVNFAYFNLTDIDNNIIENDSLNVTQTKPDLNYELSEGESGEGWIAFWVNKSNSNPKLTYINEYWFLLK